MDHLIFHAQGLITVQDLHDKLIHDTFYEFYDN